jgi:hypothetical protein
MGGLVLVLEPDLLFSSRIESVGSKSGLDVKVAVSLNELKQMLNESVPRMLLVNLDAVGVRPKSLVGLVQGACRLVGYYSHVDSKLAKEALADGFEMVIPRRAFGDRLGEIFAATGSS